VPTAPRSPYVPADAVGAAWPYNPARAAATLRAHGWRVRPGGKTVCAKPGTASDQCGAGIPAGTPIRLVWANPPSSVSSVGARESQIFAADAKRFAGIGVSFVSRSFSFLTSQYNDRNPAAAQYVSAWAVNNYGGVYTDYYPTQQGLLSPGGLLDMGGYDDPVAARLMAASVVSPSAKAVRDEVAYLGRSYPIFFMPDQDWITALSRRIGGARKAFLAMTQQRDAFQFLYLVKRP
jgi:peptide/nickel transport system substrate-binding protein